MIHQFVSEHLADDVREHGLDLQWLTWLPYHAWDVGPCVAAEVGPGVRLVLRRPDGSVFVGEADKFHIEDRTTGDDVLTRSFTHVENLVRHLRGWADEATTRNREARDAYNLTVRRMDGLCRALDAIGHLAPEAEGAEHLDASAPDGGWVQFAAGIDAEAHRLRRAVETGDVESRNMNDAECMAEADRLTREAERIRAKAAGGGR